VTDAEGEYEFALFELRIADGGEPDPIHDFLVECFLDDGDQDSEPFVSWDLDELNAMLAQCARSALCVLPDDGEDDAMDLIAEGESDADGL